MQQQELAQIRHREANLTALAAIGPRKKRKMDSPIRGAGAEVGTWLHVLDIFSDLKTEKRGVKSSGGTCLTVFIHIAQQCHGWLDFIPPLNAATGG